MQRRKLQWRQEGQEDQMNQRRKVNKNPKKATGFGN